MEWLILIEQKIRYLTVLILKYSIFISCLSKIELRRGATKNGVDSWYLCCIFHHCFLFCFDFAFMEAYVRYLSSLLLWLSWCGYGLITYWIKKQEVISEPPTTKETLSPCDFQIWFKMQGVRKSKKKSHSKMRAKRATFTVGVDKT